MDDSEKAVYEYLTARGLETIVYEPDGKVPPDFLVNGRIAIEVRRLNHNEMINSGHRGLEETSKPLNALVRKTLVEAGSSVDGTSWFVSYRYRRPLPRFKELKRRLAMVLERARVRQDLKEYGEICVAQGFWISFARAGDTYPQRFLLGAPDDHDSGGLVVSEMANNLRVCIAEKSAKVSVVPSRYSEWWLALEDRISYGVLDESDRTLLRHLIRPQPPWSKIILVNPLVPAIGFELSATER